MATTPNPNWPAIEESWGPYWGAKGGNLPANRFVEFTSRVIGTTAVQRGRQYELDQVRAGEYRLTLDNTDGAFDPTNTASPWNGRVLPFQPVRKRAQYPRTVNLLSQVQATGGDVGGQPVGTLSGTATQIFSDTDSTGGSIAASGTAFRGSTVLQFAVPNATAAGQRIVNTSEPAVEPGTTYTMQVRVRNVTPSTTLQVKPHIGHFMTAGGTATFTYGSTVTLTGSATAAWTQLTITLAAPAATLGMNIGVTVAATAGAACTVQVDEWQLEKAASATAWVQPGVWYPIYEGFAERWPQSWNDPKFAVTQPTCVDTFAILSQIQLQDPLNQEIYSRSPRFLYALGDPQNSTLFADSVGAYQAAPLGVSKYGAGTLTAGSQVTSASPGGAFTGSTGTVVTVANPNPGANLISAATFISLGSVGITGPNNPAVAWTRMIAFRYTAGTPAQAACMWSSFDNQRASDLPAGSRLFWYLDNAGRFSVEMNGPTGAGVFFTVPGASVADGNWHMAFVTYEHAAAELVISLDSAAWSWGSVLTTWEPTGLISDNIGAYVDPTAGNGTIYNWQGDLAFAAEFPSVLTVAQMGSIYMAWKNSFAGDSTDGRYKRILSWAGYTGSTSVQTGLTTAMGPAAGNTDALSALQDVVTTENGAHYVDRAGVLTFRARSDRYNKLTSTYVFGDGPGEYPYEPGVSFDYDTTRLANLVTATQAAGQVFTAKDQPSIDQYAPRTMSRTINTQSALEVQDAANFLLSRYRAPALRISSITLNPGANPTLWPVCLSLELGMRVTVNRRRADGSLISQACLVENIQPTIAADTATWTLQLSPVDTTPYGVRAAFHTTLNTSIASGVGSVVIKNATGQNNTDPAAAQLPVGGQLVLGLGTATQETVTIQSVGATTSGWTTATITLTANTTKAHTAGDVVCEALPAGITDATTWDSVSKFDQHAFAY